MLTGEQVQMSHVRHVPDLDNLKSGAYTAAIRGVDADTSPRLLAPDYSRAH